ncbi:TrkA C-terminal domain-containing protein [Streptomyces sp. NRRL S-1813]|nr:TrkA C-terminal domain-containing protein [Streptomyces sp. NRRL S-1813]
MLPNGTVIATVVRDGQPTAPEPDMRLRPGDEVLLVSHRATERDVQSAFQ